MTAKTLLFIGVAGALLTSGIGAEVSAVSASVPVDGRSVTRDWSTPAQVDTRVPHGTMILVK